jgi:hypothetical protein
MSRSGLLAIGIAIGMVLAFALVLAGFAISSQAASVSGLQTFTGSDEVPPSAQRFSAQTATPAAPSVTPTTTVYFSPSDSDGTGTVLILYNTSLVTQTVNLKGFFAGGAFSNWNVDVGPSGLRHVVSDSVAAAPPPSWSNSVVANFTDSTTYASLAVPAGVKFDGYTIFNLGTGTVDPRADQGAISLRFSTDPFTVLLPIIQNTR